ncbi:MAG TPA: phosphoribosylformylglycinamidine synthase subunit PurL [Dehalococcoidales bacterium]|nr:phosphoribosylformylglycinamidine synthase subunit PurL [Dehalococcoidales bacterium]
MHRIEVRLKPHLPDPSGRGLVKDIQDLGIQGIVDVRVVEVYWLESNLAQDKLELIAGSLLADKITQDYWYGQTEVVKDNANGYQIIEVAYNAGVTDPVKDSVMKAIRDLGILNVRAVATAKKYLLRGQVTPSEMDTIASRLLVNPIVQHVVNQDSVQFPESPQYTFSFIKVPLIQASAAQLEKIRQDYGFSPKEFAVITSYYQTKEGRDPSDVELETLAQTWSEHCVHKTFKGKYHYDGTTIDNLFKSTIVKATKDLNKPWCLSVFEDNAGVIEFDNYWALCFKVETHNHPSAVEPYGGASTGIGGVLRDPMGTGLGAKPILNTDVFCFAPPDYPAEKLPKGVLHPRRIFKGVRAGVADYANRMGIPTPNGAILFDERYLGNPLVYCGTVGLIPKSIARRQTHKSGDLIIVVGGRTGRDGIHGATFSSVQLHEKSSEVSFSAVQIGNPIVEKKMLDVLLQARDLGLYSRITDCGAGGLSSAVGEMGAETGARVDLDKVPLKYSGLTYAEIWISEAQERMVLAVPPENRDAILKLFANEDVEAAVIGEFTDNKRLQLDYQGLMVCDLDMEFLHKGVPQIEAEAVWHQPRFDEPEFADINMEDELKKVLGSWNTCSKEWVIRQYDHEVQGGSVLKPLVGVNNDGPGDAVVIKPVLNSDMGAVVANGINTRYGDIDPYWMAASAIDEALRQIIAVGGNLKKIAILDNFCWGLPNTPEMLGALVRAAQACHDMSLAFGVPFISGKDSFNNEYEYEGKRIAIPHTLLISSIGVIDNVNKVISMDLKAMGDALYILGVTGNELGGSEYFARHQATGNNVPRVDPQAARQTMEALSLAIEKGLVKACHDCSEGGLGVAVAEMAFSGGLGAVIYLKNVPRTGPLYRNDYVFFSESNSRFIVEVAPENEVEFIRIMKGIDCAQIGHVSQEEVLQVHGLAGELVMKAPLAELKEAWQKPLRW